MAAHHDRGGGGGVKLGAFSMSLSVESTDPDGTGPAHIVVTDPDGNTVMVDQFVDRPGS